MKKGYFLFLLFLFIGVNYPVFAQNGPAMYFCERYGSNGEVGISDRFTVGHITVVVKCDYELRLKDVKVQYDKWDPYTAKFKFYKNFKFTLEPDMSYVYFSKNNDSDMSFEDPGFYRVFLLDDRDRTIASALIEIIED